MIVPMLRRKGVVRALAVCLVLGHPAYAADPARIARATLQTPPDSHEPQKALVEVANEGSQPIAGVKITCAFLGTGGAVLDRVDVTVAQVPADGTSRAEAIYYGYPRAGGVSCEMSGSR